MILLWGLANDPPLRAVRKALAERQIPTMFVDQREVLQSSLEITTCWPVSGSISVPGQTADLTTITATYLRIYDAALLPEVKFLSAGSAAAGHAMAFHSAMLTWLDLTDCLVINSPSAMATNNSKPFQLMQIAHYFAVPDTLITTSAQAVRRFWEKHGNVIYKSLSGTRSKVCRLTEDHVNRLDDVQWCPTQFQRQIKGADYRVHVVGSDAWVTKIESASDDYRYAGSDPSGVSMREGRVPADIEKQSIELASALGLVVAGLDLREGEDGKWYCFEVNPCPAFTSFDRTARNEIPKAIARVLASTASPR